MLTQTRPESAQSFTLKFDPDSQERRRGLRIRQTRPVKVFIPSAARFVGGQTQDISSTGLRLELPRSAPLRQGGLLNVHVGLDGTGSTLAYRRQMLPARIIWVDREDSTKLIAGVELLASVAAGLDAA